MLNKITILQPKNNTTKAAARTAPKNTRKTLTFQEDEDQKDETLEETLTKGKPST